MSAETKNKQSNPQSSKADAKNQVREIYLNKDIKIFPNQPLPELDKGSVKAYEAESKTSNNSNLFALICDNSLTPRRIATAKFQNVKSLSLIRYKASGKILWPNPLEEKFCFVYEHTMGRALLETVKSKPALKKKPEDMMSLVINPMIDLIEEMANKDLVHGSIWPGNIFYGGAGAGDKVILGECLSAPASTNLPLLYEPVERALADPVGKGTGSLADDIYSFGVSLAVIMRGHIPEEGKTDAQIIEQKIEKGSYTTLLQNDRFSGATLELLRGLLYDNPQQRWTLEDIRAWQDGRRLSPKQSSPRIKANRPVIMGGKKYTRPELLAKDFVIDTIEAARVIENDDLMQWIDRAIEDKSLKGRLQGIIKESNNLDKGSEFSHRLSVAVSSVMFPDAPIMYKDLKFHPRAFGKYLTKAYIDEQPLQQYLEVMRSYFSTFVLRAQKKHDMSALNTKFDVSRNFIKQTKIHTGLERCLYLLNPECQCLSPIIKGYYVINAEELMDAIESVCANEKKPKDLFDRHIVSFLMLKSKNNIEPYIMDITSDQSHKKFLGKIRVLATLQKRLRLSSYPNIADWIFENMEPVLKRFHDEDKKISIKEEIKKIKTKGDLTTIVSLFNNSRLFENDLSEFYDAMRDYKNLEKEKQRLIHRMKDKRRFGLRTGAQIASLLSLLLAAALIILAAYIKFLKDYL